MDADLVHVIAKAMKEPDLYIRANDGDHAISLLGEDFDLVLLDLNLPKTHGLEVLKEIRASERHEHTPVVVFSSSFAESDIRAALGAGASAYVVKPNDAAGLQAFVASLHGFWRHHRR